MSGVNKAILIGNLGKDPEVKEVNGTKIAKFSLATSDSYKDRDGNKIERTEWHNIVLWRTQAEFAEKYLRKGLQIYLEGRIRTRNWDDKEGNKKYITEIEGDSVIILTKKSDNVHDGTHYAQEHSGDAPSQQNIETPPSTTTPEDDLPF
jgi:single-strand DNA-binding protein